VTSIETAQSSPATSSSSPVSLSYRQTAAAMLLSVKVMLQLLMIIQRNVTLSSAETSTELVGHIDDAYQIRSIPDQKTPSEHAVPGKKTRAVPDKKTPPEIPLVVGNETISPCKLKTSLRRI